MGWGKSQILVLNRVRVLGSKQHTSTQLFWEYSPLGRGTSRYNNEDCSTNSKYDYQLSKARRKFPRPGFNVKILMLPQGTGSVSSSNLSVLTSQQQGDDQRPTVLNIVTAGNEESRLL